MVETNLATGIYLMTAPTETRTVADEKAFRRLADVIADAATQKCGAP